MGKVLSKNKKASRAEIASLIDKLEEECVEEGMERVRLEEELEAVKQLLRHEGYSIDERIARALAILDAEPNPHQTGG